jgi:hypothetical protein
VPVGGDGKASAIPWHRSCDAWPAKEGILNRRNIGILAAAIGSAFAAWYWSRHRAVGRSVHMTPARERGELIYDNTPVGSAEGII